MLAAESIERLGPEMFYKASMGGLPVEGGIGERSHEVVFDQLTEGRMVFEIEGDALWQKAFRRRQPLELGGDAGEVAGLPDQEFAGGHIHPGESVGLDGLFLFCRRRRCETERREVVV